MSQLITKKGFQKLQNEILQLKSVERPKVIKSIAEARDLGDLKENSEYHSAKDHQGMIEAKISNLEISSSNFIVFDSANINENIVHFSATVTIENADNKKITSYKIVSEYEADLENGLISIQSPVAKSLLNKHIGEEVEIKTPRKDIQYKILNIKY